jgi:hypothetical protein
MTGAEPERLFEGEAPGLAHRHAPVPRTGRSPAGQGAIAVVALWPLAAAPLPRPRGAALRGRDGAGIGRTAGVGETADPARGMLAWTVQAVPGETPYRRSDPPLLPCWWDAAFSPRSPPPRTSR